MDTIEIKVAENENDKNDLDMDQNIEIIVLDNKNYYNENINYINIIQKLKKLIMKAIEIIY